MQVRYSFLYYVLLLKVMDIFCVSSRKDPSHTEFTSCFILAMEEVSLPSTLLRALSHPLAFGTVSRQYQPALNNPDCQPVCLHGLE